VEKLPLELLIPPTVNDNSSILGRQGFITELMIVFNLFLSNGRNLLDSLKEHRTVKSRGIVSEVLELVKVLVWEVVTQV
jgi:hypothetical protein